MNPMIRALTAKLASGTSKLAGIAGVSTPMGLAAMTAGDFGKGGLAKPDANGVLWGRYDPANANGRVNDAFAQLPQGGATQVSPMERISQAYDALRSQQSNLVPANSPGVFGPDAVMTGGPAAPPVGAQAPMNLASHGVVTVPDKIRSAPVEEPAPSPMSFFMRNALAQREGPGGDYLNPNVGAAAAASPFKGLFG